MTGKPAFNCPSIRTPSAQAVRPIPDRLGRAAELFGGLSVAQPIAIHRRTPSVRPVRTEGAPSWLRKG